MTKIYKILSVFACLLMANHQSLAQCVSLNPFGFSSSNAPGAYTITTCNFGDEFSNLTLNVAGNYTFASDNATDYLTLTAANSTVALASGTTPLLYTLPSSGNYELHVFASGPPTCGADMNCRTTSYTVASLPGSPTIITQPANSGGCAGGMAQFVCGATPTNCTYQWQEDQGSGFTNVINGGIYSGATSPTLVLTGITGSMNGYLYQCVITNTVSSITTTVALLNVISNGTMPLLETFNSSFTSPAGWIDDPNFPWNILANHGTGGSNGMSGNLFSTFNIYEEITTVQVGPATASTAISFDYRIVNWSGYPSTATPLVDFANDSMNVYISTNCGATYTLLGSVNASNHVVSTNFVNKSFSLAPYSGSNMVFKFVGKKDPMGTGDYYIDVDNINIFNLMSNDAGVSGFVNPPAGQPCYSATEPVVVTVKNNGNNTISNIPVTVVVSGAVNQTLTATYTPTLATTATANFTVGTLNMSAAGTYSFKAYSTFATDPVAGNDTLLPVVTRTVIATAPFPYMQDFNASFNMPTNWTTNQNDPFFVLSNHGTLNTNGMTRNLFSTIDKAETDMLRLGPVTPSTAISFDYRIVNWSGYPSTATPTVDIDGDSLKVMASINCGLTYSLVGTITASNHISSTSFANKTYTLGALAGSDVIIKFLAVRQTSNTTADYYIDVDNINLYNLTATDGGVSAVVSPSANGCYSSSQPVVVAITNYGLGPISNFPVNVIVNGPNNQTLTATYTGTLAVGATANFTVGNANMGTGGAYTFTSSTNLSGDGNTNNDQNVSSFTVNPILNIAGPSAVCLGNSATLTVNGAASTYSWSTGATSNSIVITPTANTSYSVLGTNSSSCSTTANFSVSVQNATITASGMASCGNPATGTLTASAFTPAIINWYASPTSTVSLGTGNNFTVSATSTTTYYAEASSTSTGSLFTTLAGGNGSSGNMFDIAPTANITIESVDMHFGTSGVTTTVEVWYRPGTFVGFESSNSGWTLAHTTTVVTNGTGILTPIPGTFAINVPAGQTYGLYITTINGNPITNYTNGTALNNLYTSNSDLSLYEGKGGGYFGVINSPRIFNGALHYTKQGCTTSKVPVVFNVATGATVTAVASNTSICAGTNATLTANGAANYTWTPGGATGSMVVVSPTAATTYSVYGESGACNGTGTTNLGVNPAPNLSVSPTVFTQPGTVVTLTASGANAYSWTPSGSNNSSILVSPTVTTVYTVQGTNNFSCVTTATTSIVMSGVGITENNIANENMYVYPNPNTGFITVVTDNNNYVFEVFDATGRIVYSTSLMKTENPVSIKDLANGMYTYKITSENNRQLQKTGKLIKQ